MREELRIAGAGVAGLSAARGIVKGVSYDRLLKESLLPSLKASMANRYLFERLHNGMYSWVLDKVSRQGNPADFIHASYVYSGKKRILYLSANRAMHRRGIMQLSPV